MRAQQITELTGPASALTAGEIPEPGPAHPMTGEEGVVVDVHAAGVVVPRGPADPRRVPDQAPAAVRPRQRGRRGRAQRPDGAGVQAGDRVAAFCMLGGFAEVAVSPAFLTFKLPDELDFAQGAGLILNYHTAYFSLVAARPPRRGRDRARPRRRRRRRHRSIQVAKGLGAATFAVVSSDEKERVAREAGADEVVRSDGPWKDEAKEPPAAASTSCSTRSAAIASPTACARSARAAGLVVVGFTGGSIPEVQVNRLLLNNLDVVGAGWGAYVLAKPEVNREIGEGVLTSWSRRAPCGRSSARATRSSGRATRSS